MQNRKVWGESQDQALQRQLHEKVEDTQDSSQVT